MTKYFQQTVGKMIMGIKVVSKTGNNLTWGRNFPGSYWKIYFENTCTSLFTRCFHAEKRSTS